MSHWKRLMTLTTAGLAALAILQTASAKDLNVYSSRHYEADQAIYDAFTRKTGITINRKEGKPEELLQLIQAQGALSPADVFITVDAGNIWKAEQAGVLEPLESPYVVSRVPENFRDPAKRWFGVAKRVRLIFVDREVGPALNIAAYDDLADPRLKGMVCVRQSSNIYNLSLMAARIARTGAPAAESWAKGVVANFAREPQGNDTDQLMGIASGQCKVALANHYYFVRLQTEKDPAKTAAAAKLMPIFPDQSGRGTHANITAAGLLKSGPNRAEAVQFLEFLVTDEAQGYFAELNNEFPIVEAVKVPAKLTRLGKHKIDTINVRAYGENQAEAQKVYDRAGWK